MCPENVAVTSFPCAVINVAFPLKKFKLLVGTFGLSAPGVWFLPFSVNHTTI